MKQEVFTDSEQLEQTQPPVGLDEKESKETTDLFASLPSSYLCDRVNSTVAAPYEPPVDGSFYATTKFLYETILNENDEEQLNEEREKKIMELRPDTDTLFSRFDTLPSSSTSTFDELGESPTEQNAENNPRPAKRRCVVTSETAPDVPPDAGTQHTLTEKSNSPPPPPPADYPTPAPRLPLSRRFSNLYEGHESHIDVSSFKLPKVLTIRQEHDLLSAVWEVLYK